MQCHTTKNPATFKSLMQFFQKNGYIVDKEFNGFIHGIKIFDFNDHI